MAVVWEESGFKKVILKPKDVQEILGISKGQAYRLFRREDFPSKRVGNRWFVSLKAFEKWLGEGNEEHEIY